MIFFVEKKLFLIVFLLTSCFFYGLERTLYVDNFNDILGSPLKEDKLLLFAQKNNFKVLILYELNKVHKIISLSDPRNNNILSEFINKAKQKYQIKKIGASGEAADFFVKIINVYNNSRQKSSEKFDIYNLEYEYWSSNASNIDGYYCVNYLEENNIPCGREGSFKFFVNNLKQLKNLSKGKPHKVEVDAYVGYYTQPEIAEITKYCDRLTIIALGKDPKICFNSAKKNLDYIFNINSKIKTNILFSTIMNDLGYWLKFDSLDKGEKLFFNEMSNKDIKLKNNLNVVGFTYQAYSSLEKSISYYSYNNN
ncbi:MAG: hypothetical protein COZ74_06350 [Flavobacteriaceae bacterium CG_4_8_14_3_um_filter_31_8]|nr:MAG: hypothetical protein COZ74_06350 [Flavobacteriaceae bacterium CG_4_8_14_3_um_filter_31_8]